MLGETREPRFGHVHHVHVLTEGVDSQRTREPRGTARRQHVVDPDHVVASRGGRPRTTEHGTRVAHQRQQRVRIRRHELEVLGSQEVHDLHRTLDSVDEHRASARDERRLDVGASRRRAEIRRERGIDGVGELLAPRDQGRHPARAVLGLRHEVDRDVLGRRVPIRNDDDLRGSGDRVDADDPLDLPLREGDIAVAGTDHDVDRGHGLGPEREGGDSLRAADPEHRVDTGERRSGEHDRRNRAIRTGGNAQHDLGHAGDARRDRGHEHGRGVGRAATRDVAPGAGDRDRQLPRFDAVAAEHDLGLPLRLVVRTDARRRRLERDANLRCDLAQRRVHLRGRDEDRVELDPVELPRPGAEGLIAVLPHRAEDRPDRFDGTVIDHGWREQSVQLGIGEGRAGAAKIESGQHGPRIVTSPSVTPRDELPPRATGENAVTVVSTIGSPA